MTVPASEVFFSAAFSFFEKETTIDLWEKLVGGISAMWVFMDALYNSIGEECSLCNQLREKIRESKFSVLPREFLLVNDYVYYFKEDMFERGGRKTKLTCRMTSKMKMLLDVRQVIE